MKNLFKYAKRNLPACEPSQWIRRLILAWLTAAAVEFLINPVDLSAIATLKTMSGLRMGAVAAVVLLACWGLSLAGVPAAAERWSVGGICGMLAAVSLVRSFTWPLLGACVLVLAMCVIYGLKGWNRDPEPEENREREKLFSWITVMAAAAFFLFVSIWTVCRIYSFSTPTYDFGIFAQMFHSMKTTGLPMTTLERDGPLSHFAVHVSPIYYLLLPFYALVPKPATLQVMQAAVLASGVIPLWKLGKCHGLKPWLRCVVCLALLVYPAYAGGTSYDIHENAFLTPLLFWLFYALQVKNGWLTGLFAVLTLFVKEDAAVYVAVVALWQLLKGILYPGKRWARSVGVLMLAGSVAYFLGVTGYLDSHGDGVMTYRYDNLIFDGSGSLLSVVKTVLLCPMKAVYECVDSEKLLFLSLTMLPLAGLPLLTRRYERLVLLIPYLLVNLMSDYQYQHDIFFQYAYGSTACLMYLALMNLSELKARTRMALAVAALGIGIGCFGAEVVPKAVTYPNNCMVYDAYYDGFRETLALVPEGASVASSTYYTTTLSNRDELYDVRYASREHILGCEYVVLGVKDSYSYKPFETKKGKGLDNLIAILEDAGYTLYVQLEGKLLIYQKTGSAG